MRKFKVGDKVRYINEDNLSESGSELIGYNGDTYTIKSIENPKNPDGFTIEECQKYTYYGLNEEWEPVEKEQQESKKFLLTFTDGSCMIFSSLKDAPEGEKFTYQEI